MKRKNGFTLVEVLIGVLLLALAWVLAMGVFANQIHVIQVLTKKVDVETNVRSTMIVLEKQIEGSDWIIFENNRLYMRDMESTTYLDYYSLEGINLYKYKVYESLKSIGLGSKSQMTSNITAFQLEPCSDGRVLLTVESTWEDQVYSLSKVVTPACPVYVIG